MTTRLIAQNSIGDNSLKTPLCPCSECVFHTRYGCEFEFCNRWLSAERVPDGCPRGLARKTRQYRENRNCRKTRSYRFFEYAILGELEHNGGRMTFGEICQLFPYLEQEVVLKILRKLKREGKISHLNRGALRIYDQRNVWKLGHALGGCYR